LTAYAARQAFGRTGRIEQAAPLIGSTSLDTTASLIGYHWQRGD
jgi:integrase/recombinase XerC